MTFEHGVPSCHCSSVQCHLLLLPWTLVFLLCKVSYEVWCKILAPQNDRINYSKWSGQADGKTAFHPFEVC